MTVDEIIEYAADAVGGGPYTGDKLRKAKLDLQLVMIELVNEAVPLSLVSEVTFTSDNATHTFDATVRDVWSLVDVTDNVVVQLNQVDLATYNEYNLATTNGRPTQFATHKELNATTLRLYPVPNKTYSYRCFVDKDPKNLLNYDDTLEVRSMFLPAIISGVVYKMAKRNPDIALQDKMAAKQEWDEAKEKALDADRDRAPLYLRPTFKRW